MLKKYFGIKPHPTLGTIRVVENTFVFVKTIREHTRYFEKASWIEELKPVKIFGFTVYIWRARQWYPETAAEKMMSDIMDGGY
jgi:hypothetical protein